MHLAGTSPHTPSISVLSGWLQEQQGCKGSRSPPMTCLSPPVLLPGEGWGLMMVVLATGLSFQCWSPAHR